MHVRRMKKEGIDKILFKKMMCTLHYVFYVMLIHALCKTFLITFLIQFQVLKRLNVYWKNMEAAIKEADGKSKTNFICFNTHTIEKP